MKYLSYLRNMHQFIVIILGYFLLLIFNLPVYASTQAELTVFLREIQKASDRVHSLSSSFVQEKRLALFANPVIFRGKLILVRPDRLWWEFISPIPSVLIFNQDRGIRCLDQAPPVHFDLNSDPIMRTVAEQLWLWFGGDYSKLNDLYRLEKRGASSLVITPEDASIADYIESVAISFSRETRQPKMVEIVEPGGDLTRITFHSPVINNPVSDLMFSSCDNDD